MLINNVPANIWIDTESPVLAAEVLSSFGISFSGVGITVTSPSTLSFVFTSSFITNWSNAWCNWSYISSTSACAAFSSSIIDSTFSNKASTLVRLSEVYFSLSSFNAVLKIDIKLFLSAFSTNAATTSFNLLIASSTSCFVALSSLKTSLAFCKVTVSNSIDWGVYLAVSNCLLAELIVSSNSILSTILVSPLTLSSNWSIAFKISSDVTSSSL